MLTYLFVSQVHYDITLKE